MKYAPYYPATPTPIEILKIKDTSLFWIVIAVLIAHIFLILLTIYSSPEAIKPAVRQQVVVKTVQLNPRPTTLSPVNPTASQKAETIIEKPVTQQSIPEPIPEIKVEPKKVEAPVETPPVLPIKVEEPVITPEPEIIPTPPPPIPNKPEPEVVKEQPQAKSPAVTPKKTQTPKPAEKKPKAEPKPKPDPKAILAKKADPKPAKTTNQAPVKKASTEIKKTKAEPIKKELTVEEIAAQEAEKLRQKEIAEAQVKQRELLAKAKENLAKIGESREKIGSGGLGNSGSFSNKVSSLDDTTIPQQLGNLQIDALPVGTTIAGELSAKEASYRDEIAVRLKLRLSLPDYGAVKLKLILNRSGKVESVQIISSESQKNKQYVEKTVPTLIFPAFGNRFEEASQYSFVVTLNNDH